ncbi:MAG: helix-turn-helix domain-containing protein [Muribaculaceae bacterium]|nr:helix-turn-helix domain-containing protein [Muribaculaceae bacterium]
MRLLIKNMVCRHCVAAVERVLDTLGIEYKSVEIGAVELPDTLTAGRLDALDRALEAEGFERLDNPSAALVERAKLAVLNHVRSAPDCHLKLSACIEDQLGVPFDTISRLFSRIEGRTIEKYHIFQKVERVKELLVYGNMSLDEIADAVGYSGTAHLSRQFKAVTGLTPTAFMRENPPRKPLNEV